MPVAENLPANITEMGLGVISLKPENTDGYPVEFNVAIQELKKKSVSAAHWWTAHFPEDKFSYLSFQYEVCVFDSFDQLM